MFVMNLYPIFPFDFTKSGPYIQPKQTDKFQGQGETGPVCGNEAK